MSARLALASELALALCLGGCGELLGLDEYYIAPDAGRDGSSATDGGTDAGGDAGCALRYADDDTDGYGDPSTATDACGAPAEYVTNGDDCDDGDDGVFPDADESCDGSDQDCDGAIDEGLLRPLGDAIVVEPDLGLPSNGARASHAVFSTGYAVVWRTDETADVLLSVFDRAGAVVSERGTVELADHEDGPPREPTVLRYDADGLERLFVGFLQTSQIMLRSFSTTGARSAYVQTFPVEEDAANLRLARVGNRVAVVWSAGDSVFLATFHPTNGAPRGPLEIPLPPGATADPIAIATVADEVPYVLLTHLSEGEDGTAQANVLRIDDVAPLSPRSLGPPTPGDVQARCEALGAPMCASAGFIHGSNARPDASELALVHAVLGYETAGGDLMGIDVKVFGLQPSAEALPTIGIATDAAFAELWSFHLEAVRGTVLLALSDDGIGGNVLREFPLGEHNEVGPPIELTAGQALRSSSGAAYRGHAAFLGAAASLGTANAALLRVGCP